ncbi:hypothetical protein P3L10_020800 [Capsicum annuum]
MVTRFLDVYTCAIADRMLSQRHATSLTIAEMVKNKYLNLKSSFTPAEIMDKMRNNHGIRMNYKKAYRAKEKTIKLVRGSLRESYANLPAYLYMVNTINPVEILPLAHSIVDFENDALWEWFFSMFKIAYGERENMHRLMEDANKIDERLRPYLFEIGYEKWSIAHSNVNRSMAMTSNIAESLNSANREARELPIKKLLQFMMDLIK